PCKSGSDRWERHLSCKCSRQGDRRSDRFVSQPAEFSKFYLARGRHSSAPGGIDGSSPDANTSPFIQCEFADGQYFCSWRSGFLAIPSKTYHLLGWQFDHRCRDQFEPDPSNRSVPIELPTDSDNRFPQPNLH